MDPFAAAGGGLFSSAMDIVKMKIGQEYRAQDRKSEQDYAVGMQTWHNQREDNAVQRRMADLEAAGINPILAAGQSASATGSGHTAGGGGSYHGSGTFASDMASAASAMAVRNQASLTEAQTDKTRAEAEEVRARTPTHGVQIEKMRQEITESVQRINTLLATETREYASAGQAAAQTAKLYAELPMVEALTRHAHSMANLNDAQVKLVAQQTGKTEAEIKEIVQRIRANLPDIERYKGLMDGHLKSAELNQAQRRSQVHGSPVGALSAFMEAINPLKGLISFSK